MTDRIVWIATMFLIACGPGARSHGDDDGHGVDALNGNCTPSDETTPAACGDSIDNDCDGVVDCADPSCSGIGNCPVCGMAEHPTGAPVSLPDGIIGKACTTNAQCSGGTPNCVEKECHASYTSKLHFNGFGSTQTLTQVSDIVSVCANMSHEWVRDMEVSLEAPSGQLIRLQKFLGRNGSEIFLGHPNETDGDPQNWTEQGADYCWKPTATTKPMLDFANSGGALLDFNGHPEMPPGDYQSSDPWSMLIGATLNGDWQIIVTDLWPEDAGVIHQWSIAFNPSIFQDCSGPVIQ